jgi:hypothetical protein
MVRRVFKSLICLRCGHGKPVNQGGDGKLWWPRDPKKKPEHCPVCNSPYWDKPRQIKQGGD